MRKFSNAIHAAGIFICLMFANQQASSQNGIIKPTGKDTATPSFEKDFVELTNRSIGIKIKSSQEQNIYTGSS